MWHEITQARVTGDAILARHTHTFRALISPPPRLLLLTTTTLHHFYAHGSRASTLVQLAERRSQQTRASPCLCGSHRPAAENKCALAAPDAGDAAR
eukprot:scaffold24105_cov113-Isochrysis_galbana.AAC.9